LGQPDCDEVAARFGQTAFANDGKTLTKIRLYADAILDLALREAIVGLA
jgi:hypothetical protein